MWGSTLVIFSADNGGETMDAGNNLPLRGTKFTLWEGGLRTAAFVAGPLIPPAKRGGVYAGMVHNVDWHITLITISCARFN
eukprot:gene57432-biopygen35817